MAYVIRPSDGLHFVLPSQFPNLAIAALDTGGVGQEVILGTGPLGAMEYDALSLLWGPDDMYSLPVTMGAFLNNTLLPAMNAAFAPFSAFGVASVIPTLSQAPAVQGTDPVTIPNVNNALWQYITIQGGAFAVKPYP